MANVRFAPSPTGKLHLGSARTAVFNWLYARHTGGKFVLRIEDTDLSRSQEVYTESIIRDMRWMGMDYDEFYKQSERFDIYREYCEKLIKMGKAYYCDCSREDLIKRNNSRGIYEEATKYDGFCCEKGLQSGEGRVVRLSIGENRDITFKDAVRKKITVNTKELDDFVIWKSDGSPTYNFAVVIDDALMQIDTVIRGEDHITNTAKQVILYEYLGLSIPLFAHIPLVMDKDKSPLSKRKGSTNIEYYRANGILPEALLNAIARLGWSHGNDEFFTVSDLIKYFDIDKLNKACAVYDEDKMVWLNAKHLKEMCLETIIPHFEEFITESQLPRLGKMVDKEWTKVAIDNLRARNTSMKGIYDEALCYALPEYTKEDEAKTKYDALIAEPAMKTAFSQAKQAIVSLTDFDNLSGLETQLRSIADSAGVKFGDLVTGLRFALTGKRVSPDIVSVVRLLGDDAKARLGKG